MTARPKSIIRILSDLHAGPTNPASELYMTTLRDGTVIEGPDTVDSLRADLARERAAREQAGARAAGLEVALRAASNALSEAVRTLADAAEDLAAHDAAVRADALREAGAACRAVVTTMEGDDCRYGAERCADAIAALGPATARRRAGEGDSTMTRWQIDTKGVTGPLLAQNVRDWVKESGGRVVSDKRAEFGNPNARRMEFELPDGVLPDGDDVKQYGIRRVSGTEPP